MYIGWNIKSELNLKIAANLFIVLGGHAPKEKYPSKKIKMCKNKNIFFKNVLAKSSNTLKLQLLNM